MATEKDKMTQSTVEEIVRKMDGLDLWKTVAPFHWGIKPRGTVIPYFFCLLSGNSTTVKIRILFLEGWQTFHDFVRTRIDRNFGFYQTPMELPHFEAVVLADGSVQLSRHDPGYMPVAVTAAQRDFCARLLWQTYGVMLRIETEKNLPLKFAENRAMFARVEGQNGEWTDEPLVVPDPRPHAETVRFPNALLAKAKDLPFVRDYALELDFRLRTNVMTQEARPRCVYLLAAIDAQTGAKVIGDRATVLPDLGLRGLWEQMPERFLERLVEGGRIPGEVKVRSGRVFRLLRPLCMDLPFKLSLHDSLPQLEAALKAM